MKIIENIKSLADIIHTLGQLDDPEFIQEQGLTEDDRMNISIELGVQMNQYKAEATEYIVYKLKERQEASIQLNGIEAEMKRLGELASGYQKKVNGGEKRIDYIMTTFGIEKIDTPLNKLSYRKSESISIVDELLLPDKFKEKVESIKISKTDIKKAIQAGEQVPGAVIEIKQNLQIK